MNVLLLGAGAREHAIAKALLRSNQPLRLFCLAKTSHPFIEKLCQGYRLYSNADFAKLASWAKDWRIDLAIIGPEEPLSLGLVDLLWAAGIACIGPTQFQAQLESSKAFCRDFLNTLHPTISPEYRIFTDTRGLKDYLSQLGTEHYVIKPDGLSGGKGVKIAGEQLHSLDQGLAYAESLLATAPRLLVERRLQGQEFSLHCLADGHSLLPLPLVRDYKRAYNGDTGPNTGSMGAYTQADHSLSFLNSEDIAQAVDIARQSIRAIERLSGQPYRGILYGSFMKTAKGIYLIEYNVRFGDPEAINLLGLLESDCLALAIDLVEGRLSHSKPLFKKQASVCQYLAPVGYPEALDQEQPFDFSQVSPSDQLYFGSVQYRQGQYFTSRSRTLAYLAIADCVPEARAQALAAVQKIQGPLRYREDIGQC